MPKVLIVEEDATMLRAVTDRLETAGFEVVTAKDPATAIAAAVSENADVAILDVSLPGSSGTTLAESMPDHESTAATPLIFLTACRKPGVAGAVPSGSAFALLEKPYDPGVLVDTVRACMKPRPTRSGRH